MCVSILYTKNLKRVKGLRFKVKRADGSLNCFIPFRKPNLSKRIYLPPVTFHLTFNLQ